MKTVGIAAWCFGLLFGIAKLLLYYGSGPFIVYLMLRYLT